MLGEKRLLRRVREFIPPGATVVAVEVGVGNSVDTFRTTPVILTDKAVLLVPSIDGSPAVTVIPVDHVTSTKSSPGQLAIWFWDIEERVEHRAVLLSFEKHGERDHFIDKVLGVLDPPLERRKLLTVDKAWIQGRVPPTDELETGDREYGWAELQVCGDVLITFRAELNSDADTEDEPAPTGDTFVHRWDDFTGYYVDTDNGVGYLKFSDDGLGITWKTDHPAEWGAELASHQLPVNPELTDEDWRVPSS